MVVVEMNPKNIYIIQIMILLCIAIIYYFLNTRPKPGNSPSPLMIDCKTQIYKCKCCLAKGRLVMNGEPMAMRFLYTISTIFCGIRDTCSYIDKSYQIFLF